VRGRIRFAGGFAETQTLTLTPDDLMLVLVFSGPAGQTYWAERVSG